MGGLIPSRGNTVYNDSHEQWMRKRSGGENNAYSAMKCGRAARMYCDTVLG